MATVQDNLLDWLRDAHAMEQQAESMLKGQAERLEHYPQLKGRIVQHIEETQGQQRLLLECIERLGAVRPPSRTWQASSWPSARPLGAWS